MQDPFQQRKKSILDNIQKENDKSPKGSIDAPILPLVNYINSFPNYVTTSSCSGRVALYAGSEESGTWLYVTHDKSEIPVTDRKEWIAKDLLKIDMLYNSEMNHFDSSNGLVYFKFEPFIMHIEAKDLESARSLHQLATSCGYRNSGLTVSKKRFMVAIRSSLKLDAPIGFLDAEKQFRPLVSLDYIDLLFNLSIEKFTENEKRINQLFNLLQK